MLTIRFMPIFYPLFSKEVKENFEQMKNVRDWNLLDDRDSMK